METDNIHLVKAAFKKQFEITMANNGVSADAYLKKVNLPTADLDPESLLPEKPFWHLINRVARDENMPDFGSLVAQTTPWHKVVSLAPLIHNSVSLKNLLETFCDIASSQSSATRFTLEEKASNYTFSYAGMPLYKNDVQMELYRVTSMIQLVQLATGIEWFPGHIQLMMNKNSAIKTCGFLKNSEITFSNKTSVISIEKHCLHLPVNIDIPASLELRSNSEYDLDADFVNSIRQIMTAYIQNQHCSIEDIADIADISVRTLQRKLKKYDLKFNDLLNQAKFIMAKEKLSNTEMHIYEIANILGYSDAANFSRAFHRWAGVSPGEYRQQYQVVM